MIKTGLDKGVIQISDLIKYLQDIQDKQGDLKLCVNGQYIYNINDTVDIDKVIGCIDFKEEI